MNILIKTPLERNYLKVLEKFDVELFKALKPPLLDLEVKRFDGCKKGDEVHLEIGLGPLKMNWVSHITEDFIRENECGFIDVGHVLPPPLKSWHHVHRIVSLGDEKCEIQDDITYSSGSALVDKALYPVMYGQFAMRSPVYKRILG